MSEVAQTTDARFVELPYASEGKAPEAWAPLLVQRQAIEDEAERLLDADVAVGQPRASMIVHPQARAPGLGLSPGMAVSINVLRPGEELTLIRDNATRVEFAISGEGESHIGDVSQTIGRFDVWTVPSMTRRTYRANAGAPLIWLSYSNVPLLQKLGIHYSDTMASRGASAKSVGSDLERKYIRDGAPDYAIGDRGARLRGYEFLTDIEVVENRPLHWPWHDVEQLVSTDADDAKRTIMLLYNPATERRNGTTHSFFATISSHPAGRDRPVPPRGHRHSSFACNYHFLGSGQSVVDGETYEWSAGDLLFSAPSWSEHAHGTGPEGASILTVQDHPFQIAMESLIWQERIDGPILTLGSEAGQTGYVGPRLKGS